MKVALVLALVSLPAFAEMHTLEVVHPTTYVDETPLPLSDIKKTDFFCGTDLAVTLGIVSGVVNGSGTTWSHDFSAGAWYCAARTTTTNGQQSGRSAVVTFTVAPARPKPPVLAVKP